MTHIYITRSERIMCSKVAIEHLENKHCTDREQDYLLDIFGNLMKSTATALARKSVYELKDYPASKEHGVDQFELELERKYVLGQEQFHGTFRCGNKELFVLGTLEDENGETIRSNTGRSPAPADKQ